MAEEVQMDGCRLARGVMLAGGWSSAAMLLGPEQECAGQIRLAGSQRQMRYFPMFRGVLGYPNYARSHTCVPT